MFSPPTNQLHIFCSPRSIDLLHCQTSLFFFFQPLSLNFPIFFHRSFFHSFTSFYLSLYLSLTYYSAIYPFIIIPLFSTLFPSIHLPPYPPYSIFLYFLAYPKKALSSCFPPIFLSVHLSHMSTSNCLFQSTSAPFIGNSSHCLCSWVIPAHTQS